MQTEVTNTDTVTEISDRRSFLSAHRAAAFPADSSPTNILFQKMDDLSVFHPSKAAANPGRQIALSL